MIHTAIQYLRMFCFVSLPSKSRNNSFPVVQYIYPVNESVQMEGRKKAETMVTCQVSLANILKQMLLTLTTSQLIQCSSTIVPNSFTVTHYLKYIPHFHIHENAMRKVLDL